MELMGLVKCSSLPLQHSRANRLMEGSANTWEEDEKRQSFTQSWLQLLSLVHTFCHFDFTSTCFWFRSCSLSKCSSKEKKKKCIYQQSTNSWNILDLSVALSSECSSPLTQARDWVTWRCRGTSVCIWKISLWSGLYCQALDCFSKIQFIYCWNRLRE